MSYDYEINGSLIVYDDREIFWDVIVSIILDNHYTFELLKKIIQVDLQLY